MQLVRWRSLLGPADGRRGFSRGRHGRRQIPCRVRRDHRRESWCRGRSRRPGAIRAYDGRRGSNRGSSGRRQSIRHDDRDRPRAGIHQREFEDVMTAAETARVLVEALPYIRQFAGKSVVVKLGGAAIDKDSDLALAQDVLLLRSVGVRCVLVHGGGPQVDTMLRRVGKEPEFKDGLRVTDEETLEIVRMVLVGKINRGLVAVINSQAADEPVAVGVSGEDAGLLMVTPADPALGFVGNVTGVRAAVIHRLLDDGLTPVISTVGASAEGQPYNVNADEAARAIAVAMNAEKIVYLTAVPGLLEDPEDESTLVPRLTSAELRERIQHESVGKGMIPKLRACADAVEQGVNFAHIIDGRVHHSLLIEILTDHGVGTMIKQDKSW